jgi:protein N-terminal methyltransferase
VLLVVVPSALQPLRSLSQRSNEKFTALDVGSGVGRTTKDVLLHLVDEVVSAEPVSSFIEAALKASPEWKGIKGGTKCVTFVQTPLQHLHPIQVLKNVKIVGKAGGPSILDITTRFDVVWCQWCLGHLSDDELVHFLIKTKDALKVPGGSVIVVKENVCRDTEDGSARTVFDDQDSSLTRWTIFS